MSKQCKFKVGKYNCGSYAFNLYNEDIKQGKYCDRHYWQDQAQKAHADEREACAKFFDDNDTKLFWGSEAASYIRARGEQA
jgi:hypothetical protein